MVKLVVTSLVSLLIGLVIGVLVTIFIYPYIFPPPAVNEQIQLVAGKSVVSEGTFVDHSPSDPIHTGKGGVLIYKLNDQYEIFLKKNFKVAPGPAFYVYLSEKPLVGSKQAFTTATNYEIGPLKSFKGSQVYVVSKTIDMSKIKSIVVWCKSFRQLITSAKLQTYAGSR